MRLCDVCDRVSNTDFGSTDCSLPMVHALKNKTEVDVFAVLTDNETFSGKVHSTVALRRYREQLGTDARLVVMAFASIEFSIADPDDPRMLDVAGLDASVPQIIRSFVLGGV